jgi:hypothetical protein
VLAFVANLSLFPIFIGFVIIVIVRLENPRTVGILDLRDTIVCVDTILDLASSVVFGNF